MLDPETEVLIHKFDPSFEIAKAADDEDGKWITIHGRPVFIREGESVESALGRATGGASSGKPGAGKPSGASKPGASGKPSGAGKPASKPEAKPGKDYSASAKKWIEELDFDPDETDVDDIHETVNEFLEEQGFNEDEIEVADAMVAGWSASAYDSDAQMMRQVAAKEYGRDFKSDDFHDGVQVSDSEPDERQVAVLKALRAAHVEILRAKHGDTVEVYRGVTGDLAEKVHAATAAGKKFDSIAVGQNAITSWSTSKSVAETFARGADSGATKQKGIVLSQSIKVEDAWLSHLGTSNMDPGEAEIVVGARDRRQVFSMKNVSLTKAAKESIVIDLDDDPKNANWLHGKKRRTKKFEPDQARDDSGKWTDGGGGGGGSGASSSSSSASQAGSAGGEGSAYGDKPTDKVVPPPGGVKAYAPDPHEDADDDGVTEASRVGVPGDAVPPPPDVPRLPNLMEHERDAESRFADAYERDPDGVAKLYREKLARGEVGDAPNIFNTDDAKVLSTDYNPMGGKKDITPEEKEDSLAARGIFNAAVHQTANAVAKRAFVQHLDEVVAKLPEDQRTVLVTGGGVGGGKSWAIGKVPQAKAIAEKVGAVWDAAGEQNGTENEWVLAECEKRGIRPVFAYVHADPKSTWDDPKGGVVERANGKGRMVDARLFAESYALGARNFDAFHRKHDGKADFIVIENQRGKDPVLLDRVPKSALDVDVDDVAEHAYRTVSERPGLKDYVRRGGTIGRRIWGKGGGGGRKAKKRDDSMTKKIEDAKPAKRSKLAQELAEMMVANVAENRADPAAYDEEKLDRDLRAKPIKMAKGMNTSHGSASLDGEGAWDAGAADKRVRTWAGAKSASDLDGIDWKKYGKAFLWWASADPGKVDDFKLPVADVSDGKLVLVRRAIVAARNVLSGGRGGVDVPEADRKALFAHTGELLDKFEGPKPAKKADDMSDDAGGMMSDSDLDDMGLGMDEMRQAISDAVTAKYGRGYWVEEVYPTADCAVVRYMPACMPMDSMSSAKSKTYCIPYEFDDDDHVTLAEPVEVERVVTWEPVEKVGDGSLLYAGRRVDAGLYEVIAPYGEADVLASKLAKRDDVVSAEPLNGRVLVRMAKAATPYIQVCVANVVTEEVDEIQGALRWCGHPDTDTLEKAAKMKEGIVYGVVYAPDEVDSQGEWATADEIRKAAHGWMLKTGGVLKVMHNGKRTDDRVVETYVAPTDMTLGKQNIPKGSWVIAVKLCDETCARVEKGELSGWSMGGLKRVVREVA